MLEGLDDVDWAALHHAYGPATDVPAQLRALRSPVQEEREAARYALFGNIFHQGSVYEASAAAAPFLIEIAAAPDTPAREDVLWLLGSLAVSYDSELMPDGVPIARWRATKPEGGRVYDAVRAGVSLYRALLRAGEPAIEMQAAALLAWFPEEAEDSLAALAARLDEDPAPWPACTFLAALGLLGDERHVPLLEPWLRSSDARRRTGAAIALARVSGDAPPAGTLEQLIEAACGDTRESEAGGYPFDNGDITFHAAESLRLLPRSMYPAVVEAVAAALLDSTPEQGATLVYGLMPLAFPLRASEQPPFARLEPLQQDIVRAIGATPWFAAGERSLVDWSLSSRGLPSAAPALADYISGRRRRFWQRG